MSRIEKVVKEVSDLRDFYLKLKKNRYANKASERNAEIAPLCGIPPFDVVQK